MYAIIKYSCKCATRADPSPCYSCCWPRRRKSYDIIYIILSSDDRIIQPGGRRVFFFFLLVFLSYHAYIFSLRSYILLYICDCNKYINALARVRVYIIHIHIYYILHNTTAYIIEYIMYMILLYNKTHGILRRLARSSATGGCVDDERRRREKRCLNEKMR